MEKSNRVKFQPPVKQVRTRSYKYGRPVTKTIIVRLTEQEHRKVMRKVGERSITEWFKKIAKL